MVLSLQAENPKQALKPKHPNLMSLRIPGRLIIYQPFPNNLMIIPKPDVLIKAAIQITYGKRHNNWPLDEKQALN